MKDWDVQINYGIKTGFNEAFIIDDATRRELIEKCPKSEEIIRPILLGRNIKRYSYQWEGLWLINAHNGLKSKKIPRVDVINDYPAVFEFLSKFREKLELRLDKGDHWTNLRNCAYLDEFDKPKVAWGNLAQQSQFTIIPDGFMINAPSPFFVTNNLYLIAILNSKLGDYYIKSLGVSRSGGYVEYKPMFVENLPIPVPSKEAQELLTEKVQNILLKREAGEETIKEEVEIDSIVSHLYNLTIEEKQLIDLLTFRLAY